MRILSGIAPTGKIHIGNYLAAIKQWLELQEKNECIFFIADLHALTVPYDPKSFQKIIFETIISYLATGLNPEKCILFVQSHVKEHTELYWLLNTIAPIGELMRMTQYKEKSRQFKKHINAGLLNYPVLQAADILLYQSDLVPVGKDQIQHVELTCAIAKKFNQRFGKTFKEPEALLPRLGEKIMSLTKPKKKMSKTSPDPMSYIYLFDEPEQIQEKIMKAVTDTGKTIKYDPKKKPGISNLLTIYSLFSHRSIKNLEKQFKNKNYKDFKKSLANLLINSLEPFRRKKRELETRDVYIKEILEQGKKKAEVIARATFQDVRKKMGLV